jgi:pSer/pThr/pTyr-binding forkhead associated (FHA) protein
MDALEKINKKFGDWYGKFFPSGEETGLQPAQIKRRLFTAMEDERTEGLDHNTYVPNVYTLKVAIATDNEKERQYVRTFLQADDLAQILADRIAQQGYAVKGDLVFLLEEIDPKDQSEKLVVRCAFDPAARAKVGGTPAPTPQPVVADILDTDSDEADSLENLDSFDELGTVAAVYPAKQNALASLLITHTDGRMEEFALTGHGTIRIGRGKLQGNDVQLTDPRVSKRHAHINFENGMFILYDDGSTNGTRINDLSLPPQVPQPLENGSVIQVGNTDILFQASNTKNIPMPPIPRAAAPITPAAHVSINPTGIWKLVAEDGQVYTLASRMRLGKALDADLMFIADGVASDHAHLVLQGDSYYIEDQGSSVGTRVNGEAIPAKFPVPLYDGDKIALGEMSLTLRHTSR